LERSEHFHFQNSGNAIYVSHMKERSDGFFRSSKSEEDSPKRKKE
jgi:hypothetical protein